MRHQQQYHQQKKGGMWLVVLIIVVGVIIYANSKGIINLGSIKLGNFSLAGTGTSGSCVQKVTDCGKIVLLKYNSNTTILSNSQANNENDASQFLRTWGGQGQSSSLSNYNVSSYPINLVAVRFDTSDGSKSPYVFICKSDGNLEETTRSSFC
jgi:hypothetical protein